MHSSKYIKDGILGLQNGSDTSGMTNMMTRISLRRYDNLPCISAIEYQPEKRPKDLVKTQ